ncbi:MAG: methyltransferase domain-containing protein [Gammaproteobacteria bacterium]|jgi:SAM-dependent methyltransferase|nr:methyltransferase domain-containing protein [Gammaproteobacteria bacterium]
MSGFSDHFSGMARAYQSFRPHYSPELFQLLADLAPSRERAWDCGAGGGQAARGLFDHFDQVIASDASYAQILTCRNPGLDRLCCLAEVVPLKDHCVDLVTVAQALHWFDRDRFYAEVRRILRPGGVIAVWTYQLLSISPEIDPLLRRLHTETLGGDWPPERAMVEQGYANLDFPFSELSLAAPSMWANWDLQAVMGYLSTWSAVSRYRLRVGQDPLPALERELSKRWPSNAEKLPVTWQLAMRVGRV